ncbi:MAG: LysM peptidoglycan-binding domain-containing protein [Candidatus Aminicenantes bacterium]|nr:LysM peptidoglycan-binding domain-containing protein [Candidatus Aminicenantes bacterium]
MKQNRTILLVVSMALFSWACSSSKAPPKVVTPPNPPSVQETPPLQPISQEPEPPQAEPAPSIDAEPVPEGPDQEKEASGEKEDAAELLEAALNTYQDALAAWDKGESEAALLALDEAYGFILRAQLPQDSPLLQEKKDLRLLIAQRIQQIYAARLVTVGDNHKSIPLEENKEVLNEIACFQGRERSQFLEAYKRSGLYREMIIEELRKEGMPEELSWLPMIESFFKVRALSRARALGMWQFISSTGYRFGLKRDRYIDERMDPVKSTRSAIQYLIELHAFFGDWLTALAGYNCGEIRVQNVIRSQRINYLDNFWDLFRQLPFETARYVPRMIATLLIINNPEKYGFDLPPPDPPLSYDAITVGQPFKLTTLASALGVNAAELVTLNPELRHDSTPDYEYSLRVPSGQGDKALLAVASLPKWIPPEAQYTLHTVRKGETLSTIAARNRTSVSAIVRLNNLRSKHYLRIGQRLKIPGRGVTVTSSRASTNTAVVDSEGKVQYVVRAGDTLFSIAKSFSMKLDDFIVLNGLSRESTIYPGQRLWVLPRN